MCLIVVCPPDEVMPDKQIERAWDSNPDGGGFAHIGKAGRIRPFKTMSKKAFKVAYRAAVKQFPHSPFMLHFRLATHGSKDVTNVHPFKVNEFTYMAHNGILEGVKVRDNLSDTHVFAKDWLSRLPRNWLDNPTIPLLVEDFAWGSKLAFLTVDPDLQAQWYILNEEHGHWENGKWYSNFSYEAFKVTKSPKSTSSDNFKLNQCELCGEYVFSGLCLECEMCWLCGTYYFECACEFEVNDGAIVRSKVNDPKA